MIRSADDKELTRLKRHVNRLLKVSHGTIQFQFRVYREGEGWEVRGMNGFFSFTSHPHWQAAMEYIGESTPPNRQYLATAGAAYEGPEFRFTGHDKAKLIQSIGELSMTVKSVLGKLVWYEITDTHAGISESGEIVPVSTSKRKLV